MGLTPVRREFRSLPVGRHISLRVPQSGLPIRTGKSPGFRLPDSESAQACTRPVRPAGFTQGTKPVVGTPRPPYFPLLQSERAMRWLPRIPLAASTAPESIICSASAALLQIMRLRLLRKQAVPSGRGQSRAPSAGDCEVRRFPCRVHRGAVAQNMQPSLESGRFRIFIRANCGVMCGLN